MLELGVNVSSTTIALCGGLDSLSLFFNLGRVTKDPYWPYENTFRVGNLLIVLTISSSISS